MRSFRILYAALAVLGLASRVAAQPYCDRQTVTGTYALAYEGTVFMPAPGGSPVTPLPTVGLALVSIDSEGVISSVGYQTIGGSTAYFPVMPGTIEVNSNCTGIVNWAGGGTATVVISSTGSEIHSLMLQSPMAAMVVYGTWNRISPLPATANAAPCSAFSVYGTYTLRQHGYVMITPAGSSKPSFVPGASVAIGSISRDGAVDGSGTISLGGQALPFAVSGGTIQVKSDCTGRMAFTALSQGKSLGQVEGWLLVLDGGDTLWSIELSTPTGKPATLGVMTRIAHSTATGQ